MPLDDNNTVSLLHLNNDLSDYYGNTWTSNNGAGLSPLQSKFGGLALLLNGANQYISCTDPDLNIGNSDFTLEWWMKPNRTDGYQRVVTSTNSVVTANTILCRFNQNNMFAVFFGSIQISAPLTSTSWTHMEITRKSDTLYMFINGILSATVTGVASINIISNTLLIGGYYNAGSEWYGGYINEFRLSKVARHTANFIPPGEQYYKLLNLFKASGDYYSYLTGSWVKTSNPPTVNDFLSLGVANVPTPSQLTSLGNVVNIVGYTPNSAGPIPTVKKTVLPFAKVVFAKDDTSLASIEYINSITITETDVPILVSVDQGKTWVAWGNGWQAVDITNPANTKLAAMPPSVVNTITKDQWSLLITGRNGIRFAYCLDINASSQVANVDKLNMSIDMKGTWKSAIHGTAFDTEYINSQTLKLSLYASGDYKINY